MNKKSQLQEELETKGWEFLTNEFPLDFELSGKRSFNDSMDLMAERLIKEYSGKNQVFDEVFGGFYRMNFKNVLIAPAYSQSGRLIESSLAVYVKR